MLSIYILFSLTIFNILFKELTLEQRKEEQHKYGIYFDDDYNYLQHLKDTREVTMVLQPVSDC